MEPDYYYDIFNRSRGYTGKDSKGFTAEMVINNEQKPTRAEIESKTEQFAKWVASEIFDDNWEYNKDAFAELACRKLAKLGIVIRMGDEWVLVEQEESEE